MKITDYILLLEAIKSDMGNIDVVRRGLSTRLGAIDPARGPKVKHRAILSGKEHVGRTHDPLFDGPEKKGEPVVVLR